MDEQPEAKQTDDSGFARSPTDGTFPFRLVHIVYVVALFCTAVATFGRAGLFLAFLVAAFWQYLFLSRKRPTALRTACLGVVLAGCGVVFLLPPVEMAREAARRMSCFNNLKQITLALHNYHETYKSFPPAYIPDEHGDPMHSWRVLILPFMEETALYEQYDFTEPWNGPNNRKLTNSLPTMYVCPSTERSTTQPSPMTDYVAVVGPETAWPGAKGRKISEIKDGTSSTVLVVEAPELAIHWMEPRDPNLEDAVRLLSATDAATFNVHHGREDLLFNYSGGRNTAIADGSVYFFPNGVASETWRAMFTVNGGERWSDADLDSAMALAKQPKIGKFISLAAFLLLLVLPLPWVWLNPASGQ